MKIYLINEHHEAFFIIREEYRKENIKYNLINVDEHHDLGRAIVNRDKFNNNTLTDDKRITYNDLRVSDFIVPLVHLKAINNVLWINNNHGISDKSISIVKEYNKSNIILKPQFEIMNKTNNIFILRNLFTKLEHMANIILSIDLDFFAFDNDEGESATIEITEKEYNNFMNNKYHKVRLNFGSQIKAHIKNNKYYLVFNNIDGEDTNGFRDRDSIDILIEFLEKYLENNNVEPKFIIISRSIYSGYTDQNNYKYIHEKVLEMLAELYDGNIEMWWDINDVTNQ